MFRHQKHSLAAIALYLVSALSHADEIALNFSFVKKPPHAAVIYPTNGTLNKPLKNQHDVDQKDKKFNSHIYVVHPKTQIQFKNSDEMDHNIFSNKVGNGFDIGLISPNQTTTMDVSWDSEEIERIGCKIHPKMRSYIATIPHSTYLAIDFKSNPGQLSHKLSVPADSSEIKILMPSYDPITVSLAKGESKTVQLIRKKKRKRHINSNSIKEQNY